MLMPIGVITPVKFDLIWHENASVCNEGDVVQLSAPYITLCDFLYRFCLIIRINIELLSISVSFPASLWTLPCKKRYDCSSTFISLRGIFLSCLLQYLLRNEAQARSHNCFQWPRLQKLQTCMHLRQPIILVVFRLSVHYIKCCFDRNILDNLWHSILWLSWGGCSSTA